MSVAAIGIALIVAQVIPGYWGIDALSYWLPDPIGRYSLAEQSLTGVGAFRYTPVAAIPVMLFGLLPWSVFIVLWTLALGLAVAWTVGIRWLPFALAFAPITYMLVYGNVTIFIGVAVAVGLRWPIAWLVPLLTKVTPGIGILWFVVRGEWRHVAVIAGATGVLAAIAWVLLPGSWSSWWHAIQAQGELADQTLMPRLAAAVLVTVFAARTDRALLLPFAVIIASPRMGWGPWAVLIAMPRLGTLRHR